MAAGLWTELPECDCSLCRVARQNRQHLEAYDALMRRAQLAEQRLVKAQAWGRDAIRVIRSLVPFIELNIDFKALLKRCPYHLEEPVDD